MGFAKEKRKDVEQRFSKRWHMLRSLIDNPLLYYATIIWCTSKLLQWILRSDVTVWETGWNLSLEILGKSSANIVNTFEVLITHIESFKVMMITICTFMALVWCQ